MIYYTQNRMQFKARPVAWQGIFVLT